MKKLFYALMVLASMTMFVSCGNDEPNGGNGNIDLTKLDNKTLQCWEITTKVGSASENIYVWGTEYMVGLAVNEVTKKLEKEGAKNFSVTYKANSAKTEDACEALNPKDEDDKPACWKVTITAATYTEVSYRWDYEDAMEAYIKAMSQSGLQATFEKADAADEDACKKLGEQDPQNPQNPDDPTQYDNKVKKCWKVTINFRGAEEVEYVWLTEYEVVAVVNNEKAETGGMATVTYEETTAKTEEACDLLDDDTEQPVDPDFDGSKYDNTIEKCWKLTASTNGVETVHYVWETEYEIAYECFVLGKQTSVTATYEATTEATEEACESVEDAQTKDAVCWEITSKVMGMELKSYYWGSEADLVVIVETIKQNLEKEIGSSDAVEISYSKTDIADEYTCEEKNDEGSMSGGSCWKLTMSMMGNTISEMYVWVPEAALAQVIEGLKSQMGDAVTITYEAADIQDEDACNNHNTEQSELRRKIVSTTARIAAGLK